MLISQIITDVILDIGGDTADTTLSTNMLAWVKSTLRRFTLFTRTRVFKTTSSVSVTSGANSASLPTGFLRETYVYRKDSGADIEIEKHPNFKQVVNTSTSGELLYYEIIGGTIYFDKNSSGGETVYIEHFKEIDDIASGDTWSYSSPMIEVLKDGMKYYYYKNVEDQPNASEALSLMKAGLDRLEEDFIIDNNPGYINES